MNPSENYMNQMPLPGNRPQPGNAGPVIAIVIIILLLIGGGYYFWKQVQDRQMNNQNQLVTPELQSTTTDGINAELEAGLEAMQNDDIGEGDIESMDNEFNQ